jgi:FKBP-type peptidyl-prolyl cis-trans isomerase SlpA
MACGSGKPKPVSGGMLSVCLSPALSIPPETGFGFPDPQAIQWMPLTDFPKELKPKAGQIINFTLPNGEEVPGAILELENKRVKVDFNHPLAGLEVVFAVEILEVKNN